jgi:hypothetical protein
MAVRAYWLALLGLGCTEDKTAPALPDPVVQTEEGEDTQEQDKDEGGPDYVAQLFRVSLDLRGVRPSLQEIEAIEADPAAYKTLVEAYLFDERFPERVRSLYSEVFLSRQDAYTVSAADHGLSSEDEFLFARSVGDETLRIMSTIAQEDLPYTELVVGDWTMANETLATVWPTDYPEGGTGWQKVHYTDARPAAGVLSTNSMWWRYMSTTSNANRGKANAISKILLCNDYLSKSVEFDRNVNLLDQDALNDALRTNPGCVACHHSLDPLASFLWGTYYYDYDSPMDLRSYHPERENLWEDYTGVEPSYYGDSGHTLSDLGQMIAADPRFIECATERVYSLLTHRDATVEDADRLTAYREVFLGSDLKLRSLFRAVVNDPDYRATEVSDGPMATRKMVSSDMLGAQLEDLTGFVFTNDGVPMLETDDGGLRTLAGGIDGQNVTKPAREPMTTLVLVQERLAQAAASYVVEHDRDHPDEARLFTEITFHETPKNGESQMRAQLQRLHLRLFGRRVAADGPEVEANLELWEDLYDVSLTVEDAWAGVLTVLLRDPDFLFY